MKGLIQKVKDLINIHPNYGVTHALISLAIMSVALLLISNPYVITVVGMMNAGWWIYRETQGPDQDIPWYKRLIAYPDRIGDWVFPLIIVTLTVVVGYVR